MGFPSRGKEGVFRNRMTDVQHFFKEYHEGHYKIYNLCSERNYDATEFENVEKFPFQDHNCPHLFEISKLCNSIIKYLGSHKENVVAIHCKAGKG